MIKLDHITQTYKTPEGREFKALDDVSIEIRPGEIFGIICLLYTSDAADEEDSVELGGRRTIKKKKTETKKNKKQEI